MKIALIKAFSCAALALGMVGGAVWVGNWFTDEQIGMFMVLFVLAFGTLGVVISAKRSK